MESRRRYVRSTPLAKTATLLTRNDFINGRTIDESYGGLSMYVDGPSSLRSGDRVIVSLRDISEDATVRHVEPIFNNEDRVGLEYERN